MALYQPLRNEDDRAPIPTLVELQTEAVRKPNSLQKIPVESSAPATEVDQEAQIAVVTAPVAVVEPVQRSSCLVQSFCCGCSLATGVHVLAVLDLVSAVSGIMFVIAAIILKSREGQIDHAIAKNEAKEALEHPEEAADHESAIPAVNSWIDLAANMAILYAILAVVTLYFGCKGLKAARTGDIRAAFVYYKWRVVTAVWAVMSLFFGGAAGSLINIGLSVYFCVVARSYYMALHREANNNNALDATASIVVLN